MYFHAISFQTKIFCMNKMVIAFIALLLGIIVYYLFRPSIVLFDIFNIPSLQLFHQNNSNSVSRFCSNHLSDIFWGIFINLSAVWMDEKRIPAIYRNIILHIPFIYELGLLLHIISGTFDLVDLFFYIIIFLIVYKPIKLKLHAQT